MVYISGCKKQISYYYVLKIVSIIKFSTLGYDGKKMLLLLIY